MQPKPSGKQKPGTAVDWPEWPCTKMLFWGLHFRARKLAPILLYFPQQPDTHIFSSNIQIKGKATVDHCGLTHSKPMKSGSLEEHLKCHPPLILQTNEVHFNLSRTRWEARPHILELFSFLLSRTKRTVGVPSAIQKKKQMFHSQGFILFFKRPWRSIHLENRMPNNPWKMDAKSSSISAN